MATINITNWGIVEGEAGLTSSQKDARAYANSDAFICNFRGNAVNNGDTIWLPEGTYLFSMMYFQNKDNITFYGALDSNGEPKSKIKFRGIPGGYETECGVSWNGSPAWFKVSNANNFIIKDLELTSTYNQNLPHDGTNRYANSGYIRVERKSHGGLLKNLRVYDSGHTSINIGSEGYIPTGDPNNVHDIDVEDCIVEGQRLWVGGTSAASIIAGGGADNITFTNCTSDAHSHYSNYIGPANLLATDDGTNIEYRNCEAIGDPNGNDSVAGFWAEGKHQSYTELHNCTFTDTTGGGIGLSETPSNPVGTGRNEVKAYNCYIDNCTYKGTQPWTAWCQGIPNIFELHNCTFNKNGTRGNITATHGGGVHFGGCSGIVKDCTFINSTSSSNHPGYNITWYGTNSYFNQCIENGTPCPQCASQHAQPATEYTIENNTFDKTVRSHDCSVVNGTIYENWNTLTNGAQFEEGNGNNWNWIHQTNGDLKSATTTVINSPTSNTTVGVYYDSHTTNVQYSNGESYNSMLYEMRSAINNDSSAQITAEINIADATITFTQKEGASGSSVSFVIDWNDWQNGQPFSPMNPSMS